MLCRSFQVIAQMAGPSRTPASTELAFEHSLNRNQACASCRRRRIKCDARRPVCGPCEVSSRADDCEYTDNQNRSRADILEEDISRVQDRIYELEHPVEAAGAAVFLYHPYRQPRRRLQMPSFSQVLTSSASPSPEPPSTVDAWWDSPDPPANMVENFLDTFIPYASDWGFFLDTARFRHDASLPHPIGHHSRPTPALLYTVYLIAITLSDSPALKTHEKRFLSRALSALPVSLSGLHPQKAIHALQAEVLLSNYFYAAGRFLEGRYHTTAAASLALGGGLLGGGRGEEQAHDHDEVECMEGRWATIMLDKSWAVALGTYPDLPDSLDMQWPGEEASSSTVSQFLEGTEISAGALSPKTLLAKAVILWERANSLVVGWNPDMDQRQAAEFSSAFNHIDGLTEDLSSTQPAPSSDSAGGRRLCVLAHSVAHAAVIQLHGTFAPTNPGSKQKCLTAASAILELIAYVDLGDSVFINPILSTIWVTACEVVIDEIAVLRAARPAWAHDTPGNAESALVDVFQRGFAAMKSRFGAWPLKLT
ncbi:hypothetical protein C8R46DRAFT_423643 [Mycena filopes]|nr:hypothetical protein C8R46DRAFT_423643 [Mycena filopes]